MKHHVNQEDPIGLYELLREINIGAEPATELCSHADKLIELFALSYMVLLRAEGVVTAKHFGGHMLQDIYIQGYKDGKEANGSDELERMFKE
jgi:hypothetical protein